jgi:hypothetical protein
MTARASSARPGPAVRRAVLAHRDRRASPRIPWIEHLTGASRSEVVEVLEEVGELVSVEEEMAEAHRAAGRTGYAQIRAPFDLYALVRLVRPDHIVEAGVSSGVSSAHFLLGLKRNRHGRLHSIDKPTFQRGSTLAPDESGVAIPPGRTSGWAVPARLRRGWDLKIGPTQELLPALVRKLPSVGLFLHDDLHTPKHLAFELATIRSKLAPGAVVLADNTVWTGDVFPHFARELGSRVERYGRSDLVGLRVPPSVVPRRRR